MAYQYRTAVEIVRDALRIAASGGDATLSPTFSLFTPTDPVALQYQALLTKAVEGILATVHTPEALGLRKRAVVDDGGGGEYPLPEDVYALLGVADSAGVQYVHRYYEAGATPERGTYYHRLGVLVVDTAPPPSLVMDYTTANVYRRGDTLEEGSRIGGDKDTVLIDYRLVRAAFLMEYARNTNDTSMATYIEEYRYVLAQVTGDAAAPTSGMDVRGR